MKKLITGVLLAAAFGFASQAHAFSTNSSVLDLTGETTDGAGPNFHVFPKDTAVTALSIKWEFEYDAGVSGANVSWGSELLIEIVAPDLTTWFLGTVGDGGTGSSCGAFAVTCDVDLGFDNAPGIYSSSGSLDITGDYGLGEWQINLLDSFDDSGIDGVFLSGQVSINKVPVPAALWLLGSALMGLGAFRRRLV